MNNNFDIRAGKKLEYVEIEVDKENVNPKKRDLCKHFRLMYECWHFGKPTREAWNENGYSIDSLPRKVELQLAPKKEIVTPETQKAEDDKLEKIDLKWWNTAGWGEIKSILKPHIEKVFLDKESLFVSIPDSNQAKSAVLVHEESKKEFIKCLQNLQGILNEDICSDDERRCLEGEERDVIDDNKNPSEIFLKQLERLERYFKKHQQVQNLIKLRDMESVETENTREEIKLQWQKLKIDFEKYDGAKFMYTDIEKPTLEQ